MRLAGVTVLLAVGAGRCETLALALARAGARLIMHDEDGERAARVVRSVRASGGACEIVAGELPGAASVDQWVDGIWSRFGSIRGVVFAPDLASTSSTRREFLEIDLGVWRGSLTGGLQTPFFLVRAFASRMRNETGGGRIVTIVPAASPEIDSVARVARGGLLTMTRGLAKVLPAPVRVAAVSGGTIEGQAASAVFLLGEPALASGTIVELES
jgi:NAD(P)-dependent dehydrogenase (short-subunit alcohol dehydrogenase family)